jgi:hypothetical protein
MRIHHLVALVACSGLTSCFQLEVSAQAGYAQMALDGDVGYVNGASSASIAQDIQSGFGLGDDQGVPYLRAQVDFGVPVLAASGFMFDEQGSGTLQADFGNNLTAGTQVFTDFTLNCAKVSYAFEIGLGPVSISPGLAVDFIDLSVKAQDSVGIFTEDVQLTAPIPMGFVRGQLDLGVVAAVAEVGYMQVDVKDVNAKMLDLEAMVQYRPIDWVDLFVGYRSLQIEATGLIDGDQVDLDIGLSGFLIGGGVRF